MAKKTEDAAQSAKTAQDRTVDILKRIESQKDGVDFGFQLLDATKIADVPRISSGVLSLDLALGGGYPVGRLVELYGSEGSGKSTAALQAIAAAQARGAVCAFIDAEHALDVHYAKELGVDFSTLLFVQPNSGEEALEAVAVVCAKLRVGDVIVVDSVASLVPQAELDGAMGDTHVGLQARLMSQAMRKLTSEVSKAGVIVIFINQIRCLPDTSVVATTEGLKRLQSVVPGDVLCHGNGALDKVSYTYRSDDIPGFELDLRNRGVFKLSGAHRQPCISEGSLVEKRGSEIVVGDWLIHPIYTVPSIPDDIPYIDLSEIVASLPEFSAATRISTLPQILDEDLAFMLGCYYSDGSIREHKGTYGISFTENNRERYKLIANVARKLFEHGLVKDITNQTGVILSGKQILHFFKALGCRRYSSRKVVPPLVLRSRKSVIRAFLRGVFFDTHGFSSSGFIFTNENSESIFDFANILYYFGIFADVRKDRADWYNRLYITGHDAVKFAELIGFAEGQKSAKSLHFVASDSARGKYDVVPLHLAANIFGKVKKSGVIGISGFPYYNSYKMCLFKGLNVSRSGLLRFLEAADCGDFAEDLKFLRQNRFSEVTDVSPTSFSAMDIETESGYFIADQVLTHNSKIGVVYGSPEVTSGGRALKYYATQRIEMKAVGRIKVQDEIVGQRVRFKVVKNKVAPPFREAEVELRFGSGFVHALDLVYVASDKRFGIISKNGVWLSYEGKQLGQGAANAAAALSGMPDVMRAIEDQILSLCRCTNG